MNENLVQPMPFLIIHIYGIGCTFLQTERVTFSINILIYCIKVQDTCSDPDMTLLQLNDRIK